MSKFPGRKAYEITIGDKIYTVFAVKIERNGKELEIPFVIDDEDYNKCKKKAWCILANNYVCNFKTTNGKKNAHTYINL